MKFECPRCQEKADQEFYGPCEPCITELRLSQKREAEDVESIDYEPKMNVTPNAVALKE